MSSYTAKKILLRISTDLWVHRGNGIRAINSRKAWEGATIKILQNLTVGDRRLSDGIGNETVVPKGVVWTSSQGLET